MLWKLEPKNIRENCWGLTHTTGFVIMAESEKQARLIAKHQVLASVTEYCASTDDLWLDSLYVTCELILPEGSSQVILSNQSNP